MDFFGTCMRDCFGSCSLIASADRGRLERVRGNPDHPLTRGYLCSKMRDVPGQVRHPDRVTRPMVRLGTKGSAGFREVSWDEALALVAERLGDMAASRPGDVLQFSCAGNLGVLNYHFPERLFNRMGATGVLETVCNAAGRRALEYVYGTCHGQDPEVIPDLDLLLVWGGNPAWSNPHGFGLIRDMVERGGKLVVVDPVATETARAGRHLSIVPGTDAVLAMGLAHVLVTEALVDEEAVRATTTGHRWLAEALRDYDPRRVGRETGLGAQAVTGLAGELASAGARALLLIGWGLQRRAGGGDAVRAIALLPALLGLGRRGFIYSNNDYGFDEGYLEARHLDRGRPRINMMDAGSHLAAGRFGALVCYNANPMASMANLSLWERGLGRNDLFTVVHDIHMTDTALRADVVLPATHFLESEDIRPSFYHRYLGYNAGALKPPGDAVSNRDLFRRLAVEMGFSDPELDESDEDLLEGALESNRRLSDGSGLRERGFAGLDLPDLSRTPTRSGRIELVSAQAAAEGAGAVPSFRGAPPPEWGQLILLSPVHRDALRSQDQDAPIHTRPEVILNPSDARERGIGDGDRVEVVNDIGRAVMAAKLSTAIPRGTAVSYSSPWPSLSPGGTVNFLTPDDVQEHGGGSTYNSARVRVGPVNGGTRPPRQGSCGG